VFELVAGHAPFQRDGEATMIPLLGRVAEDPVPDLRMRDIPDEVCTVLEGALTKDPAGRTPTAHAFAEGMQDAQRTLGLPPRPIRLPIGGGIADAVADTGPDGPDARRTPSRPTDPEPGSPSSTSGPRLGVRRWRMRGGRWSRGR